MPSRDHLLGYPPAAAHEHRAQRGWWMPDGPVDKRYPLGRPERCEPCTDNLVVDAEWTPAPPKPKLAELLPTGVERCTYPDLQGIERRRDIHMARIRDAVEQLAEHPPFVAWNEKRYLVNHDIWVVSDDGTPDAPAALWFGNDGHEETRRLG